ncbi:MAG: hypothetical protein WCF84_10285 [Anaerolineae bacterium]
MLDDEIALDDQSVHLQSWIDRSNPERLRIRVETHSTAPLPDSLTVRLCWDEQVYEQPLVAGLAVFENIPRPDFIKHAQDEPIPDFRLSIGR